MEFWNITSANNEVHLYHYCPILKQTNCRSGTKTLNARSHQRQSVTTYTPGDSYFYLPCQESHFEIILEKSFFHSSV